MQQPPLIDSASAPKHRVSQSADGRAVVAGVVVVELNAVVVAGVVVVVESGTAEVVVT